MPVLNTTPIYIEPNELGAIGKGMGEYKKSINMPEPWEGGWWHLRDLIKYELASTKSYLKTASIYRKEILEFRNEICVKEVNKGLTEAPYYYIFPKKQHDQSELVDLVNLLAEHGVLVYEITEDIQIENTLFKTGDIIVPMSQPFRAFVKEVLEKQIFPVRHYTPGGEMIPPYDITSWSLPLHKGVNVFEINEKEHKLNKGYFASLQYPYTLFKESENNYNYVILTANNNYSYKAVFKALANGLKVSRLAEGYEDMPVGSFVIENSKNISLALDELNFTPKYISKEINIKTKELKLPRVYVLESYFHAMDAGWTRYLFDLYNIPFKTIKPDDVQYTDFDKNCDVLVIPDENKSILLDGNYKSENQHYFMKYPPEYLKGMEKKGYEKILKFINNGGNVIAWRDAAELFSGVQSYSINEKEKEEFEFPVRDISSGLIKEGFSSTGSLLKIKLKKNHPITYGLPEEIGVFHRSSPIFATWQPYFDVDRRVIATFAERDILMSGYIENEDKIGNKSTIVWMKKGKGQIVLFSFNPQFRASTPVSYKLLFNSLLL